VKDINLKQRLIGAVVLISLAVIFVPVILDGRDPAQHSLDTTNIPEKPEREFVSRIIPLQQTPIPESPIVESELPPETPVAGPIVTPGTIKPAPAPTVVKEKEKKKVVKLPRTGLTAWAVQVGSFSTKKNAFALRDKLRGKGFNAFVDTAYEKEDPSFRVRVGPELKRTTAEKLKKKLAKDITGRMFIVKHP